MIKQDHLWPGGPPFLFDDTLFGPSTDSFLLGAFPRLRRGDRVCDLGSGTGLLGLLLSARKDGLHLTNVEIQPQALELGCRSYALSGLDAVHLPADIRDLSQLPPAGTFDLVIANPPYFAADSGAVAQGSRGLARSDLGYTLENLCCAAAHLLQFGGRFALVFRCERMTELFVCLHRHHLEPKRLRFIQNTCSAAPGLFLLECKKGGHAGLSVEPPLLLHDIDGGESEDVKRAYFRDKEV